MVYVCVSTCVTTKTKIGGKRKSHQFAQSYREQTHDDDDDDDNDEFFMEW